MQIYRSSLIPAQGFLHGWPERHGGVSPGKRSSLNLGLKWGDSPENVEENRRRVAVAAGYEPGALQVTKHVHGVAVWVVGDPQPTPAEFDGMVTDRVGVVLGAFAADCIPMLFADPVRRVVGAAHAGWRGTVNGVAVNTVNVMRDRFGCSPGDLRAALGPSIGPECFEVGPEVVEEFRSKVGADVPGLVLPPDGVARKKDHIDLRVATRTLLERAGLLPSNIDDRPPCTRCEPERFFSFRRDNTEGGVHMGFIGLR